ncbi:MAG: hypothetical protein F4Z59_08985, partial [Gemmatimonadales bacterium]|nr:hypothetical protein [Gemmatimonadales bacterium]
SEPLPGARVTWTSADPAVATVDESGLVRGLGEGRPTVTATAGPVLAAVPVAVESIDRATLMSLFDAAGGKDWIRKDNWAGDGPVGSWFGVEANADARVTALRLSANGLAGRLPSSLGELALLTELRVDGNAGLGGAIPVSLAQLPVRELHYGGTMLCTSGNEAFRAWLDGIPARTGAFIECKGDRDNLEVLYEAMGGSSWNRSTNWLTDKPLGHWFGIATDSAGNVTEINLRRNGLWGEIPPEIGDFPHLVRLGLDYNHLGGEIPPEVGNLVELRRLDLDGNSIGGRIPPEIGNLANLEVLWLGADNLGGPIPPELGNLRNLRELNLYEAPLEGSIPAEFGGLTELRKLRITDTPIEGSLPEGIPGLENLEVIHLAGNRLSGVLPAGLGQLGNLRVLDVSNNQIEGPLPAELGGLRGHQTISAGGNMLSGPLPPELGAAGALVRLWLRGNPGLMGPLPLELTELDRLEELVADETGLCMPRTPEFRDWVLSTALYKWRIRPCGTEANTEAYLTQATQSFDYPVPLIAGKSALLRVFVTAERETTETIPPVRATFFVDDVETHVANIPAGSSAIPTEAQVGELELSANAEIPAEVIQPGLEMVVEVDPDGTVDATLGVSKRIPEEGRAPVDVEAMPTLHLTLVPFVSTSNNDRGPEEIVAAASPEHELFWETNHWLPVGAFEMSKHAAVTVDTGDLLAMLDNLVQIRAMEGGRGHWHGIASPNLGGGTAGVAYRPIATDHPPEWGKSAVSIPEAWVIAHEIGHNFSLLHAPCGGPAPPSIDPVFPYEGGRTGVWGYDPRDGGSLVHPGRRDLLSYCDPQWISDYSFTTALRWRLKDPLEVRAASASARTLIVSGGAAADGALHLDPAFVVAAPPILPGSPGPYALTGHRADGSELFSFRFDMAVSADGDGR